MPLPTIPTHTAVSLSFGVSLHCTSHPSVWHGSGIKHGHAGLQFNEFIPPGDLARKDSAKIIHAEIPDFCYWRIYGERRKQAHLEIVVSYETQGVVSGTLE
jgi:hypothetical protein